MKAFFWKVKGYAIHYGLIAAVFLDPSIQSFFANHKSYAALGALIWGTVLHAAEGKVAAPPAVAPQEAPKVS